MNPAELDHYRALLRQQTEPRRATEKPGGWLGGARKPATLSLVREPRPASRIGARPSSGSLPPILLDEAPEGCAPTEPAPAAQAPAEERPAIFVETGDPRDRRDVDHQSAPPPAPPHSPRSAEEGTPIGRAADAGFEEPPPAPIEPSAGPAPLFVSEDEPLAEPLAEAPVEIDFSAFLPLARPTFGMAPPTPRPEPAAAAPAEAEPDTLELSPLAVITDPAPAPFGRRDVAEVAPPPPASSEAESEADPAGERPAGPAAELPAPPVHEAPSVAAAIEAIDELQARAAEGETDTAILLRNLVTLLRTEENLVEIWRAHGRVAA